MGVVCSRFGLCLFDSFNLCCGSVCRVLCEPKSLEALAYFCLLAETSHLLKSW